jgi:adenine-specific DNA-methyltransferase
MPTPLEKFQTLLRELLQFEQADLDFGVYRIMNLRRERMEKWLNEELPARARAILTQGGNTADDDLGGRLDVLKAALLELEPGGVDEDGNITQEFLKQSAKGKEYLKLKAQADRAPARTAAGMEPLVYNHLFDFFSRYYDTGDFIPKRRRSFAPDGRDTYAVPWDGEEVVLHWANKDQYYIKTGERFTHYRWQSEVGGRTFRIEFRLTDADLPANNNKDAKKKFNLLLADKVEWQEDKATLILPFHYRGLTPEEEGQYTGTQEAKLRESIIKRTVDTLRELPAVSGVPQLATALMAPKRDASGQIKLDTKKKEPIPLLAYHLDRWAVKNESDFFIHKDLRRFLTGELDYFLKSVVLNLDNLLAAGEQRAEPNFRLLDAVKRLGTEIVDFVSQLEDFQKALFEKKKFVLETSWCVTLDRIPASVKEEVYTAILANDRQWEEWEALYKISQWPADFATVAPRTREFLEAYPSLIFDTSLGYSSGVIDLFLGELNEIDEQTDGVLVKSENFQAINFLSPKLERSVECVYIDPPYNAQSSEIAYKNSYKHSSWITLLQNRLAQSEILLADKFVYIIAIDEVENMRLGLLLAQLFSDCEVASISIVHNPTGQQGDNFSFTHEFAHFIFPSGEKCIGLENREDPDREAESDIRPLRNVSSGPNHLRCSAANCFYPIFVKDGKIIGFGKVSADDFHPGARNIVNADGTIAVYPIDPSGIESKWVFAQNTVESIRHELTAEFNARSQEWDIIRKKSGFRYKSLWGDKRYSANSWGSVVLKQMIPDSPFTYPKSIYTVMDCVDAALNNNSEGRVLDYFGGSGTTAHAVINLNRLDSGSRKYILVEMGEYFDSVLKKRVQKTVFSEKWKQGIPVSQSYPKNTYNGISHCIKVLRLESYEDALDNIEFNSASAPGAELGLEFHRDYELRYALDWESKDCPTRLAVEQLDTPFDYTLTLRRESGTVQVKPDLPETFAYLIGLHTRRRFRTERDGVSYLIYIGTLHADGTEVAMVWRTCRGWTEANLKAEMNWWRKQREMLAPGATRVYVNGASAIEGHVSLDAEFKTRMHAGTL